MASAGTVTIDLDMATAKLEAAIQSAGSTLLSGLGDMQTTAIAKGVAIGQALADGVEKAVDELKDYVTQGIDSIASVDELSQKLGVSTDALSALRREATLSGTSFDELQTGITRMAEAASTGSTVFSKMGISVTDGNGNLKSTTDILTEVAAKFDSYSDSSAKTALAVKVFGRAGEDLIPMLNQLGSQGLQSVIDQTQAAGVLMSGDGVNGATQYANNIKALHTAADDFSVMLGQEFAPALNEAATLVKDPQFQTALQNIATTLGVIADAAVNAAKSIAQFYNNTESGLSFRLFGTVSDQKSATMAQQQLSADQDELNASQHPSSWGQGISALSTYNPTTPSGIDHLLASGKSDSELQAEISQLKQELYNYDASLFAPHGNPPAPTPEKAATGTAQAPAIGNDSGANAAQRASEQLLQLTNSLTGKSGSPDDQAWADYAKTLNQINNLSAKMVAGGMNQNQVMIMQAQATDAATAVWQKYNKQQQEAVQDYTDSLKQQTDARAADMDFQVKAISTGDQQLAQEKALFAIQQQAATAQQALDKQLDRGTISPDRYSAETAALKSATDQQVAIQTNGYAQMQDAQSNWENGAKKAFANYVTQGQDVADQTNQLFTDSFNSMGDAIATFATTGKLNFTSLVTSILSDLAKMELKIAASSVLQQILQTFAPSSGSGAAGASAPAATGGGLFTNAKGGVYNSPSLSAYSGGVYSSPQMFKFASGAGVFGEAGPEAIMPLTRGSDGKLGVVAQMSNLPPANAANVSISTVVQVSDSGTKSQTTTQGDTQNAYKQLGDNITTKARQEIANQMRPGGILWKAGVRQGTAA